MVMIDRLLHAEGPVTVTSFLVRSDNVFVDNGFLTEAGLMENMAQTAAAGVGNRPGVKEGEAPIGFIGGIRGLVIHAFPAAGDEINTEVRVEHTVFDASVIRATVALSGTVIAQCEMKIFLIQKQA